MSAARIARRNAWKESRNTTAELPLEDEGRGVNANSDLDLAASTVNYRISKVLDRAGLGRRTTRRKRDRKRGSNSWHAFRAHSEPDRCVGTPRVEDYLP